MRHLKNYYLLLIISFFTINSNIFTKPISQKHIFIFNSNKLINTDDSYKNRIYLNTIYFLKRKKIQNIYIKKISKDILKNTLLTIEKLHNTNKNFYLFIYSQDINKKHQFEIFLKSIGVKYPKNTFYTLFSKEKNSLEQPDNIIFIQNLSFLEKIDERLKTIEYPKLSYFENIRTFEYENFLFKRKTCFLPNQDKNIFYPNGPLAFQNIRKQSKMALTIYSEKQINYSIKPMPIICVLKAYNTFSKNQILLILSLDYNKPKIIFNKNSIKLKNNSKEVKEISLFYHSQFPLKKIQISIQIDQSKGKMIKFFSGTKKWIQVNQEFYLKDIYKKPKTIDISNEIKEFKISYFLPKNSSFQGKLLFKKENIIIASIPITSSQLNIIDKIFNFIKEYFYVLILLLIIILAIILIVLIKKYNTANPIYSQEEIELQEHSYLLKEYKSLEFSKKKNPFNYIIKDLDKGFVISLDEDKIQLKIKSNLEEMELSELTAPLERTINSAWKLIIEKQVYFENQNEKTALLLTIRHL